MNRLMRVKFASLANTSAADDNAAILGRHGESHQESSIGQRAQAETQGGCRRTRGREQELSTRVGNGHAAACRLQTRQETQPPL